MSEQGRIGQPHLAKQDLSTLVTYSELGPELNDPFSYESVNKSSVC